MVMKLKSEFKVFYLDDRSLGGSFNTAIHDFRLVESMGSDLGLQLNCNKSELICKDPATREAMLLKAPDLHVVHVESADLLGSPIGSVEGIGEAVRAKIDQLQLMGDRLHHLHSHDALLLLRHSFSIPKLLYIIRTSP